MIRRLREGQGMTQQELAFQVGTTSRTIQRWEQRGEGTKPDAIDLLRVLDVFGIVVPEAPQFGTLASELRKIHNRLDEMITGTVSADDVDVLTEPFVASIPAPVDALSAIVSELNGPKPPNARRRAQMRQVADETLEAAQMAGRVALALRARLEAVGSGS